MRIKDSYIEFKPKREQVVSVLWWIVANRQEKFEEHYVGVPQRHTNSTYLRIKNTKLRDPHWIKSRTRTIRLFQRTLTRFCSWISLHLAGWHGEISKNFPMSKYLCDIFASVSSLWNSTWEESKLSTVHHTEGGERTGKMYQLNTSSADDNILFMFSIITTCQIHTM